jgi:hypothetical protein
VQAALYNVNNDWDKRPQGWSAADFMPGAKTEKDEMREFVEAVQRGDKFEMDPDEAALFRRQMEASFGNIQPASPKA